MITIVIANSQILINGEDKYSLDFEAYCIKNKIGIRHINQKDLTPIANRVEPTEITLNGVAYANAIDFVTAFNALTMPTLSANMQEDASETALEAKRISGHASAGMQQFQQVEVDTQVVLDFYGLRAVGGNVVIAEITNQDGSDAIGYFGASKTAYQGEYYPGKFKSFTRTSGVAVLYLDE